MLLDVSECCLVDAVDADGLVGFHCSFRCRRFNRWTVCAVTGVRFLSVLSETAFLLGVNHLGPSILTVLRFNRGCISHQSVLRLVNSIANYGTQFARHVTNW